VLGSALLTVVQPTVFFHGLTVIVLASDCEANVSAVVAQLCGRRRTTRYRLIFTWASTSAR
jgi:hypothetical protein